MYLLWFELAFVSQFLVLSQRKGFVCVCVYLFLEWYLISSMICLQEIYLSWEMRVWVTHIFSWFSYEAASCWLEMTLPSFILSLSIHLLQWECGGKWDIVEFPPEAELPYNTSVSMGRFILVSSLGCSHKLFFSVYSDHRNCSVVFLVRWNCRFRKCFPGFTQFDQKSWKWKQQKFTKPHRKQSRKALELVPILSTCG